MISLFVNMDGSVAVMVELTARTASSASQPDESVCKRVIQIGMSQDYSTETVG